MQWHEMKELMKSKISQMTDRHGDGTPGELDDTASQALAWFSIILGAAEVAAPHILQKPLGLRNHEGVLRMLGVREIMQGVDILANDNPMPGLWARVAGDALDLAVLGMAAKRSNRPGGVATAIAMVAGITLIDIACAQRNQQRYEA